MSVVLIFIQKAIAQAVGILFGALGELLTERCIWVELQDLWELFSMKMGTVIQV